MSKEQADGILRFSYFMLAGSIGVFAAGAVAGYSQVIESYPDTQAQSDVEARGYSAVDFDGSNVSFTGWVNGCRFLDHVSYKFEAVDGNNDQVNVTVCKGFSNSPLILAETNGS